MPYTDIYDVNVYKQVYTHHVVYKHMRVSVSVHHTLQVLPKQLVEVEHSSIDRESTSYIKIHV